MLSTLPLFASSWWNARVDKDKNLSHQNEDGEGKVTRVACCDLSKSENFVH